MVPWVIVSIPDLCNLSYFVDFGARTNSSITMKSLLANKLAKLNILMLIKRRLSQFSGFIEKKYRLEHAFIINYIL